MTSVSIGVTKTKYVNGATPVVTNLLAAGANGLPTAVNANPYVTSVALPSASQIALTDRTSRYIVELTFVLPATSTVFLPGIFLDVAFNHN